MRVTIWTAYRACSNAQGLLPISSQSSEAVFVVLPTTFSPTLSATYATDPEPNPRRRSRCPSCPYPGALNQG